MDRELVNESEILFHMGTFGIHACYDMFNHSMASARDSPALY